MYVYRVSDQLRWQQFESIYIIGILKCKINPNPNQLQIVQNTVLRTLQYNMTRTGKFHR